MIANSVRPPLEKARSVGFPKSNNTSGDSSNLRGMTPSFNGIAKSGPLKKQAKGRWFISCVIFSFVGFISYSLWNELGRYQAYGEIEGTVIQVAPIAAGRIATVEVREGDFVRQGQLLAVVDTRELQMNMRKIRSELQLALSNLCVRMAEVRERSQERVADKMDRRAEYYKLLSEYHDKQTKLEEVSKVFECNQRLRSSNSVSEVEYLASKFTCEGLKKQNDDLRAAIAALEPSLLPVDNANELLKPEQIRILEIQSELADIESLVDASRIVAPVAGRIIKRKCNAGEYVDPSQPVVELLQAGSVEGVVYLPQHSASLLKVDDTIELIVVPLGAKQAFRVHRISPELAAPPQALRASYRAFKGLVRVHVVPVQVLQSANTSESQADLSSWIHAELALPRFFFRVPNPTPEREYRLHSTNEGA